MRLFTAACIPLTIVACQRADAQASSPVRVPPPTKVPGLLRVQVLDSLLKPLNIALVTTDSVNGKVVGAITNDSGIASVKDVRGGPAHVLIRRVGYKRRDTTVFMDVASGTSFAMVLAQDVIQLAPVTANDPVVPIVAAREPMWFEPPEASSGAGAVPYCVSKSFPGDCRVVVPPVFDTARPPLPYAPILASAGVSATARARIVVDTTGRVILSRTKFLRVDSTVTPRPHALADAALRAALPTMRFTPGRMSAGAGGTTTSLEIEVRFLVAVDTVPSVPVLRQEAYPWGIRIITGPEPLPRSPRPPNYSRSVTREIHRAIIKAMLPLEEASEPPGGRATCVAVSDPGSKERRYVDPDPDLLKGFDIPQLFPYSKCPPSYWSMIALVDSLGNPLPSRRPPGAVDPASMAIVGIKGWSDAAAVAEVRTSTGGGGRVVQCTVVRKSPRESAWTATCTSHVVWMS